MQYLLIKQLENMVFLAKMLAGLNTEITLCMKMLAGFTNRACYRGSVLAGPIFTT